MTSVLYVGLGTTGGWRHADRTLAAGLARHGVAVHGVWPAFTRTDRLRNLLRPLTTELVEAYGVRLAVRRNEWRRPDALVVSSSTAALLLPRRWLGRTIVWTDTPVYAARPGGRNAALRWRERRVMPHVRLAALQPLHYVDAFAQAFPHLRARTIGLPVPVERAEQGSPRREPYALIYGASPHKKGLDLAVRAWAAAGVNAPLKITGIAPGEARAFLSSRCVTIPDTVEFLGFVPPAQHRALSARAHLYLSTSRREEYGNAQLEALRDGALLVSGPCTGTAEPRALALEIDPRLVADDPVDGVAACIRLALAMPPHEQDRSRARAHAELARYSRAAFDATLRSAVLPALGSDTVSACGG